MNTDRNGEKEYDLATVRSDIATINTSLAVQAANLASVTASLARLATKSETVSDDVTLLKVDVAVIRSNYATKADLASLETHMVKWFVSTWIAMAATTFAIVKFFH